MAPNARRYPRVRETLAYYDAATAARFLRIPVHCACARIDPAVAPEGQFSIYNALAGSKSLFPLTSGHMTYAEQAREERELLQEIDNYFRDL